MKILIALPVYNEQLVLEKSLKALVAYCRKNLNQHQFEIVICDNNSTDATRQIAEELQQVYPELSYVFINKKGKGNAWRQAFLTYEANVYCMMDIDLATDLSALPMLVDAIIAGSDLAIGSRFVSGATVRQSLIRSHISQVYIRLINMLFGTDFTDFQCGFKAMNRQFRDEVLSKTRDNEFFLDTEMLLLGHRLGYKISEIPVQWSDFREPQRASSINVVLTIIQHIYKVILLRLRY